MAEQTQTATSLLALLKKSRLLEPDRIDALAAEYTARHAGTLPEDPLPWIEFLIEREAITRWQADKLLAGKSKGFFLGKYKLLRHLGSGGMSSVYVAEHVLMHQLRAIKVLPKNRVNDSSYLARFRLEAQATARLDHRNIVRAYDIDNDRDQHYIVMELVRGRDLQSVVKEDGPLSFADAARYIEQAAEGLHHAHEHKLIHRDIKPANLLVDDEGTVKILDLGLALFSNSEMASLTIAHNENVLGTADYLAPEQAINSHTVDHRADVYSLGGTMYYLLTGHAPFNDGTLAQRIARHQTVMPEDVQKDRPDCPRDLSEICMRMMQKKPHKRYQSAQEVAVALSGWLVKHGFDSTSPTGQPSRRFPVLPDGGPAHDSGIRDGQSEDSGTRTTGPDKRIHISDTVYDNAQETLKGLRDEISSSGRKHGSSIQRARSLDKSLPKARAIEMDPENVLDSSSIVMIRPSSAGRSSASTKQAGRSGKKKKLDPIWMGVAAGGVVLGLLILLALVFMSGGAPSRTPAPEPDSSFWSPEQTAFA